MHVVQSSLANSVFTDSGDILLLNCFVSDRTNNKGVFACFFVVDVVLALYDRNVCEDERSVDFLVENCAVVLRSEFSHFDIGNYLGEFLNVVVTECSD